MEGSATGQALEPRDSRGLGKGNWYRKCPGLADGADVMNLLMKIRLLIERRWDIETRRKMSKQQNQIGFTCKTFSYIGFARMN